MPENLDTYIRQRVQALDISLSELCREAGVSRQTLYDLADIPRKLPTLATLIQLARVLGVHPLRLLNLVFDSEPGLVAALAAPARKLRSDQSAFVRDVTFPDDTLVFPGQRFVKTWEVQNVGKVAWENRFLQCVDEEIVVYARSGEKLMIAGSLKPQVQRISVPLTKPGDAALLSVSFVAAALPGTVMSYWKSVFEDGRLCFPKASGLWCKVRVSSLTMAAVHDGEF